MMIRYADDFVCAFQFAHDAEPFYKVLSKRLKKFNLDVAEDKISLMRFSRFHAGRKRHFVFLGFEFYWRTDFNGKARLRRRTDSKKQKAKLDKSADKIAAFLKVSKEKLGSKGKPVKSNITDPDSAKMTTSKGTIQGYNGIAINDDKHQIILQAQTWGSVGEQQTLKPAQEQLEKQFIALSI